MSKLPSHCLAWVLLFFSSPLLASPPAGIDWFQGGVKKAFQKAKKSGKPVFLYWGADWCIPCLRLRKVLFPQKSFQKRMKNFISVYLDGDAPGSNDWLKKYKGLGYPTMILFNSQELEQARLPVKASVEQINKIIDRVLSGSKSMQQILTNIKKLPAKKVPLEYWAMAAEQNWKTSVWKMLYEKIPSKHSSIRYQFLIEYLLRLSPKELKKEKSLAAEFKLAIQDKKVVKKMFAKLTFGTLIVKIFYGNNSPLLNDLFADWRKKELSLENSLISFYPVFKQYKENVPEPVLKEFFSYVEQVKKLPPKDASRQPCLLKAIYLLSKAGMYKDARDLASLAEKDIPTMGYLSSIEEKLGNYKKALEWSERAWKAHHRSKHFTRGIHLLEDMIRLTPQNGQKWYNLAQKVFSTPQKENFWEGNEKVFKKLGARIQEWAKNPENRKYLKHFRIQLRRKCKRRSPCLKALKPLLRQY